VRLVRIRGIEPRAVPWEGTMLPLHQMRMNESRNTRLHVLCSTPLPFFSCRKGSTTWYLARGQLSNC